MMSASTGSRRNRDGPAIAAIGWMTDPIGRTLGEEDSLIDVGGHGSATKMLAERAGTHQDDVAPAGVFLCGGAAATRAAHIIAHADQAAFVERVKFER